VVINKDEEKTKRETCDGIEERFELWGGEFWSDGYFVSTVSK
jgi:REP element-mobilizing transposase RayT